MMPGGLGGVDHQLLPQRAALIVVRGQHGRARQQPTVTLAHLHPLGGDEGPVRQVDQIRHGLAHMVRTSHGDDHQRHIAVATEEVGPAAFAAKGAVDPEQHAGAGEVMPMEQFADHLEGVAAIDVAVTADMHRQFDLIGALGQRYRSRVVAEKPGRLQGDQPAARHVSDV